MTAHSSPSGSERGGNADTEVRASLSDHAVLSEINKTALPEDMVLVPRKQSHEQAMAGYNVACHFGVYEAQAFRLSEQIYAAMLDAASIPKE